MTQWMGYWTRSQDTWVLLLVLPPILCVTIDKLLHLSLPHFPLPSFVNHVCLDNKLFKARTGSCCVSVQGLIRWAPISVGEASEKSGSSIKIQFMSSICARRVSESCHWHSPISALVTVIAYRA